MTRREAILGGMALLGGYALGKPVRSALGGKSEAAKSGWQNPYVQDGLVAMWDGIQSEGNRDLIGGLELTLSDRAVRADNCWDVATKRTAAGITAEVAGLRVDGAWTVEMPQFLRDSMNAAFLLLGVDGTSITSSGYGDASTSSWMNLTPSYHWVSRTANEFRSYTIALTYDGATVRAIVNGTRKTYVAIEDIALATVSLMSSAGIVYGLRVYNRVLPDLELWANSEIDKRRFGL